MDSTKIFSDVQHGQPFEDMRSGQTPSSMVTMHTMAPIGVAIVESTPTLRFAIRHAVERVSSMRIVTEIADLTAGMRPIMLGKPQVIIAGERALGARGITGIQALRAAPVKASLVISSIEPEIWSLLRLMKLEAAAYISNMATVEVIEQAVRAAAQGQTYMDPTLLELLIHNLNSFRTSYLLPRADLIETLSSRERTIFELIAEGASAELIANQLSISAKTVHNHRLNIVAKLGLEDGRDLVKYAKRMATSREQDQATLSSEAGCADPDGIDTRKPKDVYA